MKIICLFCLPYSQQLIISNTKHHKWIHLLNKESNVKTTVHFDSTSCSLIDGK